MTQHPAAPIIEPFDMAFELAEGDQVVEVFILAKVSNFGTGGTGLVMSCSDGMDWILQRGMLDAARYVLNVEGPEDEGLIEER